ncbi:MAG TPA: glutathione S-transferase [Stellaceae bacterium]|nr:glutathione S-transferase [Stellaceae bacterium]
MKLLYQTHSPYARQVLVLAHETGLADRLEVCHHETSPTRRNEAVFAVNPLGKVPALVLDDGLALFDSAVICDYLDGVHGGPRLIPLSGPARWLALRRQAIAHGIADAGGAVRQETERRPAPYRYPAMRDGQAQKLVAAYDFLEQQSALDGPLDIGHIALATALSWIEFRNLPGFRAGRGHLESWYDRFARRPSMLATPLAGEVVD